MRKFLSHKELWGHFFSSSSRIRPVGGDVRRLVAAVGGANTAHGRRSGTSGDARSSDSGRRGSNQGDAGEYGLLSLSQTSIRIESEGGVYCGGSYVGISIEIGIKGETVLVLEGVDFEGAERLVGDDLGTLAFPLWCGLEAGGRLLQGVEQKPGATIVDAIVGEGVNDLLNAGLDGVQVVENGHLEAAGVAVNTSEGGLYAAGAGFEVEIAITLIMKSGRTAIDAICLEMVTGTVGHGAS